MNGPALLQVRKLRKPDDSLAQRAVGGEEA